MLTQEAHSHELPLDQGPSFDERGLRASRAWDVLATGPMEAYAYVRRRWGVTRNALYVDPWTNSIPDLRVRCRTMSCEVARASDPASGSLGRYIIRAEFGVPDAQEPEADPEADPVYVWDGSVRTLPVDVDANGQPIVNSADEPYDPPVTDEQGFGTLTVRWYVERFDPRQVVAYSGAKNSDRWRPRDPFGEGVTVEAGQAMIRRLRRQPVNTGLLQMEMVVAFAENFTAGGEKREGWDKTVVDRGYREKVGDGRTGHSPYRPILDDGGEPITEPALLNGSGGLLTGGGTKYRTHVTKKALPFGALGV